MDTEVNQVDEIGQAATDFVLACRRAYRYGYCVSIQPLGDGGAQIMLYCENARWFCGVLYSYQGFGATATVINRWLDKLSCAGGTG